MSNSTFRSRRARLSTANRSRRFWFVAVVVALASCSSNKSSQTQAPSSNSANGIGLGGFGGAEVLNSSGAIVGQSGTIGFFRESSEGAALIKLTSSEPLIATVPSTASIEDGELFAVVPFQGISPGEAIITAEFGGNTYSGIATVVKSIAFTDVSSEPDKSHAIQVGATTTLDLHTNISAPLDIDITLTSSDPKKVSVPNQITLRRMGDSVLVPVTGEGAGDATVTARIGESSISRPIRVLTEVSLVSVTPSSPVVQTGASTELEFTIDAEPQAPVYVDFTSSNTAVATFPVLTVEIPQNTKSTTISFRPIGKGTTTFTAKVRKTDATVTSDLRVVDTPNLKTAELNRANVLVDGESTLTLTVDAVAAEPLRIALTSTDTGIAQTSGEALILPGSTKTTAKINLVSGGTTNIVAKLGDVSLTSPLRVENTPTPSSLHTEASTVLLHSTTTMTLRIETPSSLELPVTLSSSDQSVATVPTTAMIPSGNLGLNIPVTLISPGWTTLTTTLGGLSVDAILRVVAAATVQIEYPPIAVVGMPWPLTVSIDVLAEHDMKVALSSSPDGGVLDLPDDGMTIASGTRSATIHVAPTATGMTTLTATVDGSAPAITVVAITPTASLASLRPSEVTLAPGAWFAMAVTIDTPSLTNFPVTLSHGCGTQLLSPELVKIPAGETSAIFLVNAVSPVASCDFTASGGGIGLTSVVHVVQPQL